ncbi:MAG: type III-B CRISPR module-associated protein Cmr5 [Halobacteria archaeon]
MIQDPIKAGIEDMKVIMSLIAENESLDGKFRARARSLPSLINEIGLVPTLSFCYGKAEKEVYENVKKCFYENRKIDKGDEEKKGYALYLLITLNYLKKLGLITSTEDVVEVLKQLSGKGEITYRLLRPYLLQIKRLAEALFKPESGGT